jgi:hypothetical protein
VESFDVKSILAARRFAKKSSEGNWLLLKARAYAGYCVSFSVVGAIVAVVASAQAETRKNQPVYRSAAGTVIQPTRTIIHHPDGTTPLSCSGGRISIPAPKCRSAMAAI